MVGSIIQTSEVENEAIETHITFSINYGRTMPGENIPSQTHVTERTFDDRVRKEVGSVAATIENRLDNAILMATDSVIVLRVEMTLRQIIGYSGQ